MRRVRRGFSGNISVHAGSGTAHARLAMLPQPGQMVRHFGIAFAHHGLEVVTQVAPFQPVEKAVILIGFASRVNSGAAKTCGRRDLHRRYQHQYQRARQRKRRQFFAYAFGKSILAKYEQRNIGAQLERQLLQLAALQAQRHR